MEQDIVQLVGNIKQLPAFPAVAIELLNAALDSTTPVKQIAKLIETDPSIASKIIRLVNSPIYGFNRAITNITDAVRCLGFNTVKNMVLSISVFDMFAKKDREFGLDREAFWIHSFACGICSELIAKCKHFLNPATFFVAGLLHDIGKLVLDTCIPERYGVVVQEARRTRKSIIEAEQTVLGTDHTIIGKWIAEKWNFPENLIHTIWFHHQPPDLVLADVDDTLLRTVQLSNLVVKNQRIGNSGDDVFTVEPDSLLQTLGIDKDSLNNIKQELFAEVDQRIKGIDAKLESTDVFFSSLQRANEQLGELYADINAVNRSLAVKNERFTILNEMNASFQPNQEIKSILNIIHNFFQQKLQICFGFVYVINIDSSCINGVVWGCKDDYLESITIPLTGDKDILMEYTTGITTFIKVALSQLKRPDLFGQLLRTSVEHNSLVVASISHKGEMVGKIAISNDVSNMGVPPIEYGELCAFASSIGLAIQHTKMYRKLMSRTEALTTAIWRREQLHKELLNCERLAAVGKMAAGAAHEINNPLSIISGRAQMLAMKEADLDKKRQLEVIIEQSNRISKIVSDLLGFARPPSPEPKKISVNYLINKVVSMLDSKLSLKNIIVVTELSDDIPYIWVDEGQLEQVFINLLINAQQAIEGGGKITISSKLIDNGEWVQIKFSDTGIGIPPEHLDSIFEPFFTTKEEGEGTGLGLSLSYGIIKAHGGNISVESIPNQGTTFYIKLPVKIGEQFNSKEKDVLDDAELHGKTAKAGKKGKILVVDDERDIQDILREVLTDEGYIVDVASNGQEGLSKARRFIPDLIILDIRMPVKNGIGFLSSLKQELNGIPVIVVTGVATEDEIKVAFKSGVRCCIRKPFSISKLLSSIREVLNSKKANE